MSGFNDYLGVDIIGPTADGFAVSLEIDTTRHHHDAGMVHGGVILSLLDTVISRTLRTEFDNKIYAPTLTITVNFFRPALSGKITAIGRIINRTRSVCCLEGRLYNESGDLLAVGTANHFLKGRIE